MMDIIIQLFVAWVGSLGFSLIFNPGKKTLLPATLGGMVGWGVYLLVEHFGAGIFLSTIAAAAFCQVYAEVFSRILKCPRTVIYIPAVVPLVPGGSLYYTMYYAAVNDWPRFMEYGAKTAQVAFGMAVGASFVSAIVLLLPHKKKKESKKPVF